MIEAEIKELIEEIEAFEDKLPHTGAPPLNAGDYEGYGYEIGALVEQVNSIVSTNDALHLLTHKVIALARLVQDIDKTTQSYGIF